MDKVVVSGSRSCFPNVVDQSDSNVAFTYLPNRDADVITDCGGSISARLMIDVDVELIPRSILVVAVRLLVR